MVNGMWRVWSAVAVLCLASFTMVTSEFAPIGLLSLMAADLGQDPATLGLTVTLYAWIGAASGLLAHWFSRRVPRKVLLIALMLILAAANALSALSANFPSLLAARALGAVAHGVFWATVAATAASIAPPRRLGLATSIVLGGITLATVLGVPLVNLIGQYSGWRQAFVGLGLMCLLSAVAMFASLPSMALQAATDSGGYGAVLRRRDLLLTYLITGLTAAAHFAAYTFIEPYIGQVPGITPYLIASLLFTFGAAGFIGNLLSALLLDRYLKGFILVTLLGLATALMLLGAYGPALGLPMVVGLLGLWGVSIAALFTALQTWVLRIAGPDTVPAAALHTAVLNAAIGVGVIAGGHSLASSGVASAMMTASLVIVPALLLMLFLQLRARTQPLPAA